MSDKILSIASSKPISAAPAIPAVPSAPPTVKFEIGDVVQLQSGGPPMTVRKSSKTNVAVDWLLDSGELYSAAFEPAMLLLCPSDEPYDEGDDLEVEVTLEESDTA